ncbi:MAG TPA: NADP-dependent oxidoreductase [Jiangellaceae bacterium]|nr:NADP-dependent oxidoreductase [Jiangellaceae bacterium]
MRAARYDRYGDSDVLSITDDAPEPLLGPDAVLVAVRAAGVNPVDTKVRRGYLEGAFLSYLPIIPGWDAAGVVEAVGPAVTEFTVGDEVIGYVRKDYIQHGTAAERVAAPVRALAAKPREVTFTQAASLPLAGLTAIQMLEAARVHDDDLVLVHAASGGVGHLAVQLARARGARVIGTASEANHDFLRSLGAEPVTYGEGLPERVRDLGHESVDASLDLAGGEALEQSFALTREAGRVVSILDASTVLNRGGRYVFVRPDATQLTELGTLVDTGAVRPQIAATYPLEQIAQAHDQQEAGHVRGKLVLEI